MTKAMHNKNMGDHDDIPADKGQLRLLNLEISSRCLYQVSLFDAELEMSLVLFFLLQSNHDIALCHCPEGEVEKALVLLCTVHQYCSHTEFYLLVDSSCMPGPIKRTDCALEF